MLILKIPEPSVPRFHLLYEVHLSTVLRRLTSPLYRLRYEPENMNNSILVFKAAEGSGLTIKIYTDIKYVIKSQEYLTPPTRQNRSKTSRLKKHAVSEFSNASSTS